MAKINLKTLAYQSIRSRIVSCEYAPGTYLNEELLTASLGLSRTPVRDALSRLEQEGLVRILPKRGILVKDFTPGDIRQIFEIRLLYEPYILRTYGSMIPEEALKKLYEIFQTADITQQCYENKDHFYKLDYEFHHLFMNTCPNEYLLKSYELIQVQNERLRHVTGDLSDERLKATIQEHLDIIRPCLSKAWEAAEQKLIEHLNESKKAALQLVMKNVMEG